MNFWKKRGEEYKEERLRTARDEVGKKTERRKFLTLSASHVRNLSKSHNDLLDVKQIPDRHRSNTTEEHNDTVEKESLTKRVLRYSVKDLKLFEHDGDKSNYFSYLFLTAST